MLWTIGRGAELCMRTAYVRKRQTSRQEIITSK